MSSCDKNTASRKNGAGKIPQEQTPQEEQIAYHTLFGVQMVPLKILHGMLICVFVIGFFIVGVSVGTKQILMMYEEESEDTKQTGRDKESIAAVDPKEQELSANMQAPQMQKDYEDSDYQKEIDKIMEKALKHYEAWEEQNDRELMEFAPEYFGIYDGLDVQRPEEVSDDKETGGL